MTHIFKDKSMCCKAEVRPNMPMPGEGDTVYYMCTVCGNVCDLYSEHSEEEDRDINVPIKIEEEKVDVWSEEVMFVRAVESNMETYQTNIYNRKKAIKEVKALLATATKKAYDKGCADAVEKFGQSEIGHGGAGGTGIPIDYGYKITYKKG